jgi:hypothetical protein
VSNAGSFKNFDDRIDHYMPQKIKTIIKFNFIVEFIDFKRINADYPIAEPGSNNAKFHFPGIFIIISEKYLNWH